MHNLPAGGAVLARLDRLVTSVGHDLDDVDVLFGLDLLR
jgi:hypothetical protein